MLVCRRSTRIRELRHIRLEASHLAKVVAHSGYVKAGDPAAAAKERGKFCVCGISPCPERTRSARVRSTPLPYRQNSTACTRRFWSRRLRRQLSLLEVLVAAWEPLTEEVLAAASGLDAKDKLPEALQSLSGYLAPQPRRSRRMRNIFSSPSIAGGLAHASREAQSFIRPTANEAMSGSPSAAIRQLASGIHRLSGDRRNRRAASSVTNR